MTLSTLTGCASVPNPIPRYATTDRAESLAILRDRMSNLHTVRGEAAIRMTSAKGDSVSLDGAYVLAKPGRARLRAWKFGQAVFDLTLDGDKAWAFLPREEARPAAPQLRKSLGEWFALLTDPDAVLRGTPMPDGDNFMIVRSENGMTLCVRVDRATLTAREYSLTDNKTLAKPFVLKLSDYRVVGDGQVWPMTIRATSDNGVVEVRSHDVDVNADIDTAAFKPPARAEALP